MSKIDDQDRRAVKSAQKLFDEVIGPILPEVSDLASVANEDCAEYGKEDQDAGNITDYLQPSPVLESTAALPKVRYPKNEVPLTVRVGPLSLRQYLTFRPAAFKLYIYLLSSGQVVGRTFKVTLADLHLGEGLQHDDTIDKALDHLVAQHLITRDSSPMGTTITLLDPPDQLPLDLATCYDEKLQNQVDNLAQRLAEKKDELDSWQQLDLVGPSNHGAAHAIENGRTASQESAILNPIEGPTGYPLPDQQQTNGDRCTHANVRAAVGEERRS